jgi:KaiC/GvpD/RAD55 family RecA-like ATPase
MPVTRDDAQDLQRPTLSELEQVSAALARFRTDDLRNAVRRYVRTEKAHGMPPETVLARLKVLVGGIPPSRFGSDYTLEIQRALVSAVVAWCISAYYDEP